ncbi:MAG: response regulator transcription factor [Acholeplasma sp.]|nr:response regulator transcription factor [Acholeplasma sp.]
MKILLVEDEKNLVYSLKENLINHGFTVEYAFNGLEGLDLAIKNSYDLIILDIMLPSVSGLEIITNLRKKQIQTPVIFLTALSTIEDKVKGLNLGANDYLTKPFAIEELLARINVLLRFNTNFALNNKLFFHDLELNLDDYTLVYKERKIILSAKEFKLMEFLMSHPKSYLNKEQIINTVWDFDSDINLNTVEVFISFLRKKLSFIKANVIIKSHRNVGYRLELSHD